MRRYRQILGVFNKCLPTRKIEPKVDVTLNGLGLKAKPLIVPSIIPDPRLSFEVEKRPAGTSFAKYFTHVSAEYEITIPKTAFKTNCSFEGLVKELRTKKWLSVEPRYSEQENMLILKHEVIAPPHDIANSGSAVTIEKLLKRLMGVPWILLDDGMPYLKIHETSE